MSLDVEELDLSADGSAIGADPVDAPEFSEQPEPAAAPKRRGAAGRKRAGTRKRAPRKPATASASAARGDKPLAGAALAAQERARVARIVDAIGAQLTGLRIMGVISMTDDEIDGVLVPLAQVYVRHAPDIEFERALSPDVVDLAKAARAGYMHAVRIGKAPHPLGLALKFNPFARRPKAPAQEPTPIRPQAATTQAAAEPPTGEQALAQLFADIQPKARNGASR